ncbi:hypothetical protein L7F22_042286 [Adiantum nelumboides]|nr:hypothetical protein [Adiantum nelumboides]
MTVKTEAIESFFSTFLPLPDERQSFTAKTAPIFLLPPLLLIIASYIRLRHPNLSLYWRAAFAIVGVPVIFRSCLSNYVDTTLSYRTLNFSSEMFCFVSGVAAYVFVMLFVELLLMGKEEDYDVNGAKNFELDHTKREITSLVRDGFTLQRPRCFPGTNVPLVLDILASLRGLGYGRGIDQGDLPYKAGYDALTKSQLLAKGSTYEARKIKWNACKKAARIFVVCYLILDFIESFYRRPEILTDDCKHGPCSIGESKKGRLGSAGPMILTALLGTYVVCVMQTVSSLVYLCALLPTRPSQIPITISRYEPLPFAHPHFSDSLRAMWGIHWHGFFRRFFLIFGYYPIRNLITTVGLPRKVGTAFGVLATFLISGLMHEMCLEAILPKFKVWDVDGAKIGRIRTSERGFGAQNFRSTQFFLIQGIGIIFEDIFTNIVEPRIAVIFSNHTTKLDKPQLFKGVLRRILGWIWCMTVMVYFGHMLLDIWLLHGIASAGITFQFTHPLTQIIVDLLPPVT